MRNKTLKRAVALALACGMTISLAACGGSGNAGESTAAKPTTESTVSTESTVESTPATEEVFDAKKICEGVKLKIAVPEDPKVEDWNTNLTTVQIEEALGVDLEFITYPSADFATKINIMVNGGDELPDIIFRPDNNYIVAWAEEGAILQLDDYFANPDYSANLKKASEEAGYDIASYMKQADGNSYAFPSLLHTSNGEVKFRTWVYTPWLEKVGAGIPTTTEEFFEVCKAVVEGDANGNGKRDEMAMVGAKIGDANDLWFRALMTPFIYAFDTDYIVVNDGKLRLAYDSEEWREGLRYVKRFFDEELIPKSVLTMDYEQYQAVLYQEEHVAFGFNTWQYNGSDVKKQAQWTLIPGLKGPSGEQLTMYKPALPGPGAIISTDCENPDAAFLVLDYMCSEEMSISNRWGQRGVDWDYWDEAKIDNKEDYVAYMGDGEISFIAYDDAAFWASKTPQNRSYLQAGPYIVPKSIAESRAKVKNATTEAEADKMAVTQLVNNAILTCLENAPDEVADYMPMTADESAEIKDIKASISSYVTEMTSAFLAGNKDLDKDWEAYLAELDKIGVDTLLEVYQEAYTRVH